MGRSLKLLFLQLKIILFAVSGKIAFCHAFVGIDQNFSFPVQQYVRWYRSKAYRLSRDIYLSAGRH